MPQRSDARRNRARLIDAAARAIAAADAPMTLEAVARDAGVGIGTLYRHFGSREVLVEAVYRTELAEVSGAAGPLLACHPPVTALRCWMDRYATFVAAKKEMAESLHALFATDGATRTETRTAIVGAVEELLRAGVEDGSLRGDVKADDVVSSLLGIFLAASSADQVGRLLDLLVDGLVSRR